MTLGKAGEALTDEYLVRQHLIGDRDAFPQLYVRHLAALVRFLRRRVWDAATAEDLAQETFAQAMISTHTLRDPSRFYPWLTVIAKHLAHRHHRLSSDQAWPARLDRVDAGDGPDLQVIRRLDQEDIEKAMARIHPRHRTVLELRERRELPYAEIARVMGIAESTVPPLLHRARRALRREYFAVTKPSASHTWSLAHLPSWAFYRLTRMRDRAALLNAYLPEAGVFCATATCIAVTVGLLVATVGNSLPAQTSEFIDSPNTVTLRDVDPASTAPVATPSHVFVNRTGAAESQPTPAHIMGIAQVDTTRSGYEYDRDYARNHMPYYYEFGDFWFAADPEQMQRDLTGTLDGETGWMGDADPNRRNP